MGLLGGGVAGNLLFGAQYYRGQSILQPSGNNGTEWFWAVGVAITLIGATLTVVGFMVQKTAHAKLAGAADSVDGLGAPTRPYWMESRWLLGGAIWIAGNFICWIALGLAPQTILAAINCWNIVITLVIAPRLLGEPVSKQTTMSAALLAFGTGWVIAFGPKAYQMHTTDLILEALKKPQSIIAFAMTFMFLLTMSIVGYTRWHSKVSETLSYFQFTAISATFAWYATLLSKSTAKVLVASVQLQQSLYLNPYFWVLASAFPICAALQVHFLNMGLKNGEAVIVIPMYEALSMTGQIVIGGLVFDEFGGLGPHQHAMFWPGVAIVMLGIASLAFEVRDADMKKGCSSDEKIPLLTSSPQSILDAKPC